MAHFLYYIAGDPAVTSTCTSWQLHINENGKTVAAHDLCLSNERHTEIYTSSGNMVQLQIVGSSHAETLPPFVIQYKGTL